jgi:hypothetical protein
MISLTFAIASTSSQRTVNHELVYSCIPVAEFLSPHRHHFLSAPILDVDSLLDELFSALDRSMLILFETLPSWSRINSAG